MENVKKLFFFIKWNKFSDIKYLPQKNDDKNELKNNDIYTHTYYYILYYIHPIHLTLLKKNDDL